MSLRATSEPFSSVFSDLSFCLEKLLLLHWIMNIEAKINPFTAKLLLVRTYKRRQTERKARFLCLSCSCCHHLWGYLGSSKSTIM